MQAHRKKYNQRGFSLIEVTAAAAVIGLFMLGIFSLLVYSQKIYRNTANQFAAAMLSQEGAELVRNIRDSNWLNALAFDDGIEQGTFRIDATSAADIKASIMAVTGVSDTAAKLKILDGFYRHDDGADTLFSRAVTVENIDETGGAAVDGLKVTSTVAWDEYGTIRQRQTVVLLYDWRQ